MKKILFLMFIVSSMFGRNFNLQIPLELRPDSGCIIFTNRTHDTLDLDTIAVIDTNGIWHKYGEFSDSLWAKILHGEYGVLDSLLADTIKGYLKGKADSAEYADSADWSDLLDGYNEDYFRDTLDVWRDSLWAYAEATDSFATSKLKADFITPDDSGQITFTDGAVFDSTLFVKVVDYALPMGYYYNFTVTTGSYNPQIAANLYGSLKLNQWNLDSIEIDSVRILHYSSADSIALHRIELHFVEMIDSTGFTSTYTIISGDSINYATGESDYKTKTLPASAGKIIEAPFHTSKYVPYWHNRSGASITCRIWEWIVYLRAFYSK